MRLNLAKGGAIISRPTIEARAGTIQTHRGSFQQNGLPNIVEIAVPPDAAALSVDLRPENTGSGVELFLYDCTTGECFSYDVGFPAAKSQRFVVRRPAPGRWIAAVDAAPFPASPGGFVLDEIITTGQPVRRSSLVPRPPGAIWQEAFRELPTLHDVEDRTAIVMFELLDASAEQLESDEPWSRHPAFVKLRDRPVAIATAIYRR